MKSKYILIAIIGVIVFIAIFTNPSIDEHKEAMKNKLNPLLQKNLKQELNEMGGTAQAITMMLGGAVLDGFVDNAVSSDNYILFSTTKMTLDGEIKVVGIGAFGNVFISNKIDKAIEENLNKTKEL